MPQKFEHGEISFILYVINRNLSYDEYVPANVTVEFSSSYNSDLNLKTFLSVTVLLFTNVAKNVRGF